MAKRIVDDSSLIKVADAIRNKCSTSDKLIFPDGFESAIASIDTAGEGIVPAGTIHITENNKTFDVTTYASAEVNIPKEDGEEVKLQSKAVTPNAEGWTVTPDSDYTGLSKVTVSGDSDLIPANIKKDVNIFGVTGTYEGTGGTGPSGSTSNLVTKNGTTTTATFDTGLSEIVAVYMKISETLQEKGLEHMTAIVPLNIYTYAACSSYNTQYDVKMYAIGNGVIGDILNYCVLNGSEVTWNASSSATPAFLEGKTYTWSAVGYE